MKKHRKVEDNNLSWASRRDFLDENSQDIIFVFFLLGHRDEGWGQKNAERTMLYLIFFCALIKAMLYHDKPPYILYHDSRSLYDALLL
jgi:hypothetical protein